MKEVKLKLSEEELAEVERYVSSRLPRETPEYCLYAQGGPKEHVLEVWGNGGWIVAETGHMNAGPLITALLNGLFREREENR